jgi:phosphomannomutase
MALILHLLAESVKPLDSFPRFSIVKEKLVSPSQRIPEVLRMFRREFERFPMDTRDGMKLMLPAGWFLLRSSNTEPIIRIVAEAKSEAQAREIAAGVYKQVALY